MDSASAVVLAAAAVVIIFAVMILRGRAEEKQKMEQLTKRSWGTEVSQLFSAERVESILHFAKDETAWRYTAGDSPVSTIDEITANDVDLDRLCCSVCRAVSSPGEEVLFAWLRHPLLGGGQEGRGELARREALMDFFAENPEQRAAVQRLLYRVGHMRGGSFSESIDSLMTAEPVGGRRYLWLSVLTAAAFVLLFIQPLAAVIALVPVLFLDFRVHIAMRDKIAASVRGFNCLLRLLRASDELGKLHIPEISASVERAGEAAAAFRSFRKGSFWVTSGGSASTGAAEAILEYIKMFFHFDLLQFDAMLRTTANHRDDAMRLLTAVGELDAALSAASWRASLRKWCRPALTDGAGAFEAAALYHPLLADPKANSIHTEGSVLLTGSNASGKSTFLKNAAIAAILAQSVATVPAEAYRAPWYRVISSMALRDNLFEGESYFIVEIRSLKRICDAAETDGAPVLGVVDEVLRGTNTVERIAASAQILKNLAERNTLIFAATHDIELSYMLEGSYRNLHFREQVKDGDVSFDYVLREGRAEGRNALRLLEAAGYDKETVENAKKSADRFEKTGEWKL